ncbi:MAG: hypothetical protein OHK0022_10860 [Roseiflexaceae bacterium]
MNFDGPLVGFFEHHDGGWATFMPFAYPPGLLWDNPNLSFVDLTGPEGKKAANEIDRGSL